MFRIQLRTVACAAVLTASATAFLPTTAQAQTPPPFHYVARLGLFDAAHTGGPFARFPEAPGQQVSILQDYSDGGYYIGISRQYGAIVYTDPRETQPQTAWVANRAGVTTRVGYYDALHTRSDGMRINEPIAVNNGGVVIGTAVRYAGSDDAGASAWISDRFGRTIKIGYYDATHTSPQGVKFSRPTKLTHAGKLLGFSLRYSPSASPGAGLNSTAWVANTIGQISRLGLFDAAHTGPAGEQYSYASDINEAGYIVGSSMQYADSTTGSTAWVRMLDKSFRRVGFYSTIHTSSSGIQDNSVANLTESGYFIGSALTYSGSDVNGRKAFVGHVSRAAVRGLGLYTGNHHWDRYTNNTPQFVNEAGQVAGTAAQYAGPPSNSWEWEFTGGRSVWVADTDGPAIRVGLYGEEHTDSDGLQYNHVIALNNSGSLIGTASLPGFASSFGQDGWVANVAGQTTRLGLMGSVHNSGGIMRLTYVQGLTEGSKLVWGKSRRYQGGSGSYRGETAWIYDRTAKTYRTFDLSIQPGEHNAYSEIRRVREDGMAVGRFQLYGADGSALGYQAFVYIPGRGTFVLGEETDVDLESLGWDSFVDAQAIDAEGYIAGQGQVINPESSDVSSGVYLVR